MIRTAGDKRLRGAGRWAVRGVLGAGLLGLAGLLGCTTLQTRFQSEDEVEHYSVETVGDKTMVGNAAPIPVGGVGLVVGLEGTGGDCQPDAYRAMLETDLQKDRVKNIKEVMSSPNHAMVLISALVQPGAAKGDHIDLEVNLPHGSRATSLRGGRLRKCLLYTYDYMERLHPDPHGPRGMLRGHPIVEAEGMILAGLGDTEGEEAARDKHGRIWGGGRCLAPQPFSLILNPGQQYARVAALIAERINETFQTGFNGEAYSAVAVASDNQGVRLRVPPQYRLNTPRFLRVVRLIPLTTQLDLPTPKGEDHRSYRQRLTDDLLDPARTVTAALRLEALGDSSRTALKKGLESKPPLVRFCSAEALAYLGDPSCGEELATAVAHSPVLRAFGLTAMASLDEAICHVKLGELLTTARDDETRYGAFRALRALNPRDPLVRGELLNDSFWLHRIGPHTPPLVHISSTRRAEIVVYGQEPTLRPDFGLQAGDFVMTASKDDDHCTISRVPMHGPPTRRRSSLEVVAILRTLAEMGCLYPEAVALLQQASTGGILSCRLACDALPQAVMAEELVQIGLGKSGANNELLPAGQSLGETPGLFDNGLSSYSSRMRQQQVHLDDAKPRKEPRMELPE
jgi:hypothetical protein